jgi:hypothetical protein
MEGIFFTKTEVYFCILDERNNVEIFEGSDSEVGKAESLKIPCDYV